MRLGLILTAAGLSQRFGGQPKLLTPIQNKPLIAWAAESCQYNDILHYIVTIPESLAEVFTPVLNHYLPNYQIVFGGPTRAQSIQLAIAHLQDCDTVLIHDAARPYVNPTVLKALLKGLDTHEAVVPGLPVSDTIKQVDASNQVISTPPRSTLRAIQTPQAFKINALQYAYRTLSTEDIAASTDEASLCEKLGKQVLVIPGDPKTFKITYPEDIETLK